jgi:hypothetical protein
VQFGGGIGGFGGSVRLAVTAVPVADQSNQVRFSERERPRWGECVQQIREDVREFVALIVEDLEQVFGFFVAGAFEMAAEAPGFAAQRAVGGQSSAGGCCFGADEFALDIDVADLAGGLTETLEQAERFAPLLVVWRQPGEHGEQG